MKKVRKLARVVIDDDSLVSEAVRIGGHRTKREAVEHALEEFIQRRKQLRNIDQFGKIDFDPNKKQRRRK